MVIVPQYSYKYKMSISQLSTFIFLILFAWKVQANEGISIKIDEQLISKLTKAMIPNIVNIIKILNIPDKTEGKLGATFIFSQTKILDIEIN